MIEDEGRLDEFAISHWEGLMGWLENEGYSEKFRYLILIVDSKSIENRSMSH